MMFCDLHNLPLLGSNTCMTCVKPNPSQCDFGACESGADGRVFAQVVRSGMVLEGRLSCHLHADDMARGYGMLDGMRGVFEPATADELAEIA